VQRGRDDRQRAKAGGAAFGPHLSITLAKDGVNMPIHISRTALPSTVICCDIDNQQFFRATTRTRAIFNRAHVQIADAILHDVMALDQKAQDHDFPSGTGPKHYVKIRYLQIDDAHGDFTIHVDYIHDQKEKQIFSEEDIKLFLGNGIVRYFGQCQYVEVSVKTDLFSSDYFSPIADKFYES
jgi:hypothetical protein